MSSKMSMSFFLQSKRNRSFLVCHLVHSTNKTNKTDSEKDLFILMNEFEQESHGRASQNRARQPFKDDFSPVL